MWILNFYQFDLGLDPMTLILKHDLDIVKRYVCTENEASTFNSSKVIVWTDRYTDRQIHRHTDTQMDRFKWKHYLSTYADGNKSLLEMYLLLTQETKQGDCYSRSSLTTSRMTKWSHLFAFSYLIFLRVYGKWLQQFAIVQLMKYSHRRRCQFISELLWKAIGCYISELYAEVRSGVRFLCLILCLHLF